MAGDGDGGFDVRLLAHYDSLPFALETFPLGCGWRVGGATGLQAKENTRDEQGQHREAERFFEGHLVSVAVGMWIRDHELFRFEGAR